MLSPNQFSHKSGLSYAQVLFMCKNNEINAIKTCKGHYKIPEKELDKFVQNDNVPKEKYEAIIRENERLKAIIEQLKKYVDGISF